MERNESLTPAAHESPAEAGVVAPSPRLRGDMIPSQQPQERPCPACRCGMAVTPPSHIYAIGQIQARFASIDVEKEFSQATGRAATGGLTDRQALYEVLKQNRYLVRQLCWVFTIEGLETYLLQPSHLADFDLLVEALRLNPSPMDVDVVIGVRGPTAPPEMCDGLMIPIVFFDQLYSFDRDSLLQSIPRPENVDEEQFKASAEQLFDQIIQLSDNAGATDEHRALNYLAARYPAIYQTTYDAFRRNSSLTEVTVRPSRLSGTRKIVDVIFSYTDRQTDVIQKYYIRVDVGKFPFLVTKMSPYYDR